MLTKKEDGILIFIQLYYIVKIYLFIAFYCNSKDKSIKHNYELSHTIKECFYIYLNKIFLSLIWLMDDNFISNKLNE